jgi:signal transduction histidine kinase
MLFGFDWLVGLSLISIFLSLYVTIYVAKMKNKKQIHYAFICTTGLVLYWSIIRFIQLIVEEENTIYFLEHIHYIGVCLMPLALLFTGIIFAKTSIEFSKKLLLLLIIPIASIILALTNNLHHLFIVKYSFISTEFVYGPFYTIHELYSYICIFLGLYYLFYFTIKNAGFFSKQSFLLFLGVSFPLIVIILSTQKIVAMPVFLENISFSVSMLFFAFAIFKFQFLNVVPIALQRIVDLISDSYIVINENMVIIDYNKTFVDTFQSIINIKRRENIFDVISNPEIHMDRERMVRLGREAREKRNSISFEEHITCKDFDKYFEVELTPVFSQETFLGTIVLYKDISEHKKNIEIIKRNQEILMEQERMASLGQMIGGIAHNLNTPIMSLAGGIEALKDLVKEYRESVDDDNVTVEDHYEIADEMLEWLEKMKPYCSYMTDLISAVKGQAVQMNYSKYDKFTVEELIKRIDVLMKHELKKHHCILKTDIQIEPNTEIKGELNSLVQVIDNLIMNAIHAYDGETGEIAFRISEHEGDIEFVISDHGKGMPKEVQDKLFKEMLTTKGKHGTGLGLYMSYSTIKGRFFGTMKFESQECIGTKFYITIPGLNKQIQQEELK